MVSIFQVYRSVFYGEAMQIVIKSKSNNAAWRKIEEKIEQKDIKIPSLDEIASSEDNVYDVKYVDYKEIVTEILISSSMSA